MARDSYVAVTGSFGGGEDGEENWEGPPIGEEVAVKVMRPRVIAERVISVKFSGEGELVAWTR